MKRFVKAALFAAVLLVLLTAAGLATGKGPKPGHGPGQKHGTVTETVFATGFNNPRGLTFGPIRSRIRTTAQTATSSLTERGTAWSRPRERSTPSNRTTARSIA